MSWYYAEDGKQIGPIEDPQFTALVQSGRVQPGTLVWREGMPDWRPYRDVAAGVSGAAVGTGLVGSAQPTEAACAECGRVFSQSQMIRHGDRWICANCKPVFLQKLAEGAMLDRPNVRYAGFWIRVGATIIDGLLLAVVNIPLAMIFAAGMGPTFAMGPQPDPQQIMKFMVMEGILALVGVVLGVTYETLMVGKYGATLGKMACGIRIVTAEGLPVTYLRAFGRYFGKMLSYMICYIGVIMAGFDDEKRSLHDRICNTRVIYK